jgi:hypothetical protein
MITTLATSKNLKEEKNTGFAIRILTKELINSHGFDSQ